MEPESTTTVPGTGGLAAALARAQGEMGAAIKDRNNPAFHQKYATLAAVIEAVRPALSKHGIAFVQLPSVTPTVSDGKILEVRVSVTTMLMHKDESIANTLSAKLVRDDVQAIGSVITYLRRYSLMAMAGVAPDDDDDGNSVSGKETQPAARRQESAPKQESKKEEPKPEVPSEAEQLPERTKLFEDVVALAFKLGVPKTDKTDPNAIQTALFNVTIDRMTWAKVLENRPKFATPSKTLSDYAQKKLISANLIPAS